MRATLSVFSFLFCALFFSASTQAACGGGGFKSSNSKPAVSYSSGSSSSSESYNVNYRQSMPTVDMRHYDSAKLQLSERQQSDIARIKQDVEIRAEGLRNDVDRAQAKLDRCDGRCDKERRRLNDATARLRDFENREFSQRLSGILTEQQKRSFSDRNDAR